MNLFITDHSPVVSAEQLDDKRVNNQIRECGQMLSTVLQQNGLEDVDGLPKKTHVNHPVTQWVGDTRANFMWTVAHMHALCHEKQVRFPDNKPHAYSWMVQWFKTKRRFIPAGKLTPFINCARNSSLGLDYTDIPDVHLAYKRYMMRRWMTDKTEPKFTNRVPPQHFWDALEKRAEICSAD